MEVFVSEEISPREVKFHLVYWTDEVTWQKLLQWSSFVFVCKMLKTHLARQKQIHPFYLIISFSVQNLNSVHLDTNKNTIDK